MRVDACRAVGQRTLAACLLPLLLAGAACGRRTEPANPPPRGGRPPNVVIVLVDTLRADRLGVNGYPLPTTPELDALAADGIDFTTFFSQSTWTKPSVATLFTSLYPAQHGAGTVAEEGVDGFVTDVLADDLVTIAERFRAAGYATVGVVNQVHLQPRYGFAQGFELYESRRGSNALKINQLFREWLLDRPPTDERPMFAYLHYLDVHWPYTRRPQENPEAFGDIRMLSAPPIKGSAVPAWVAEGVEPADLRALEARYDREVAYVDAAIGSLVRFLAAKGLLDETILVVTADHGEGFLEHGRLEHSFDPFDEVTHIPLVIHWPQWRGARGIVVDSMAGLIDLMPTLLDLAGLEPEPQARGHSLVPAIARGVAVRDTVIVENAGRRTARNLHYKLMERPGGLLEFYDLGADPDEAWPLRGTCAESGPCADLQARLAAFAAEMDESGEVAHDLEAPVNAEDVEDLKALGYL